jgi:undecaprenyl-diphosphatase
MAPVTSRITRLGRAAVVAAVLTVPAVVLAVLIRGGVGAVLDTDAAAVTAATDVARDRPALHRALLVWEEATQARWVNLGIGLVALWAWRRRGMPTRAAWAMTTLLVAWGLANVAKYVVQRTRPVIDDALGHSPGFSFPSGHSMNTMAAGLVLAILLWPLLSSRDRVILTTAAAAVVLATGLDRVFLGAHFPSDVLAGYALGAAVVGASWLGHRSWHTHDHEESR